ncbi:MAG: molybdopterin-dependent oxidoreductase [Burkholderiales bacterium]
MVTSKKSFCRICAGYCGVELRVSDQGKIIEIRGDKENERTEGYICFKGARGGDAHNSPQRLLHPLKRMPDGSFQQISPAQAFDEIAAKLKELIASNGPETVAAYRGTQSFLNVVGYQFLTAWMAGIGSDSLFSTLTIDQSAKMVSAFRLGYWRGGKQNFTDADVWMFVGYNPPLSNQGGGGFYATNSIRRLREARERGIKIVVIDPRQSEITKYADLHLQIRPGEDAAVAAGLVNIILRNGWEDRDFCAANVINLDALREAVAPFDPDHVAQRAGIGAAELVRAAEIFARDGRRGTITTGTGGNMGPFSNLAQHLYDVINVICGRFMRAGEKVISPGVLYPTKVPRAEVAPPRRSWEDGPHSRVRGWGRLLGEKLTGSLADEILVPGKGQIRALVVCGGNPAVAVPNQTKVVKALSSLDLLISLDPVLSETGRLAHYILPPTMQYERADLPMALDYPHYWPGPFSQCTEAIVSPPEGSEVVEEWRALWEIGRRMDLNIRYCGHELDLDSPPSSEQLLEWIAEKSKVPLSEMRLHPSGQRHDLPEVVVLPPHEATARRFDLMPSDVTGELLAFQQRSDVPGYPFRLAVRRLRDVMNSNMRGVEAVRVRTPYNPAFVHPDDMETLGVKTGDRIEVRSEHGSIIALVEADETIKRNVVSVSHNWGGLPEDGLDANTGVCTNRLISDVQVESINAMAWMTGIPVRIQAMA